MPSARRRPPYQIQGVRLWQVQKDHLSQEPLEDVLSEMGAYSKDEKKLMHFFQESLAGAAINWYTNLEASRIRSWNDLMAAFIR